jgi:hypothetical protein
MPGVTSTMGLCTNSICHYWIGRILARIQQAITLVAPSSWLFPETAKSILSPFRKLSGCELGTGGSPAWTIDSTGCLPKHAAPLHQYLTELEGDYGLADRESAGQVRYAVSQRLNPDSLTFLPGGIYKQEKILVCGHIGTIFDSEISRKLYNSFVSHVTKDFEKIGSYRVGPEAVRLMNEGYRMVTIGITSPAAYDLYRSVAR